MRYNNYHKHDHISNIFSVDTNTKQEDYIKRCIELGHNNYFTTNHGSFGDIFEAKALCEKYGTRCIAGIEGYIVPNPLEKDKSNYHIIVIPCTDAARKKMNYVSSHANIEGYYYRPRFFIEDLLALNPNDIYITTACVAGLLRDEKSVKEIFLPLYKHFGEHVLLELQAHNENIQKKINQRALKLQNKYGLRIVAACDSHYIYEQDQNERLELLKGKHITYDSEDSFILDFPDDETLFKRFQRQGVLSDSQIEEAIKNTLIFDECEEIQLDHSIKMPTIYPDLTPDERVTELKKLVTKEFKKIAKEENIVGEDLKKHKEGIRYEMKIIEDTNDEIHTADYFLFNYKNVHLAVEKYGGVLTRGGRGSCASFYINRVLGMTQLDRFHINLPIFPDRFASTARLLSNKSLPDIDFNIKEQEPFVKASKELLGENGCYPMWAPNTMQLSEAFRNVCRSHNLNYDEYNEIAKNIEQYIEDNKWKPYIEEAQKYVGTIVAGSVHPCAHLLSSENLLYEYGVTKLGDYYCILVTSAEADAWGLLKNDYLIVSVWKLIDETFKEVGIPIIPATQLLKEIKDDERIWALFDNGITCTLNQVDSNNGTQQAKRYGIRSLEDGAMLSACIRPSFDAWREKFLNHEEYSTGSKQLDEVLSMTNHYITFQECLMQYFEWLGVTPAESINLIKRISKKKIKPEDFANLEERIKNTWIEKTGSEDMFEETWQMIQGCMSYGFAAPHAAATSLDMCYGAYLKVHYPYEYYSVCFNNYAGDEERTRKLTKELDYFGITMKGIKFRHSKATAGYDKENKCIYKGVGSIKFVSEEAANALYSLKDNVYESFIDLLKDIKPLPINSRQLDILIKLDFFSEFGKIGELLAEVELFNSLYGKKQIKYEKFAGDIATLKQYATKTTEKMAKFDDTMPLIRALAKDIKPVHFSLKEQLETEREMMGYIVTTKPNLSENNYYVSDVYGYNNKRLKLYQLSTGKTIEVKNRAKKMPKVEVGDFIDSDDIYKDYKWIPLGEDENGKMKFKQSDDTKEWIMGSFKFLGKKGN